MSSQLEIAKTHARARKPKLKIELPLIETTQLYQDRNQCEAQRLIEAHLENELKNLITYSQAALAQT